MRVFLMHIVFVVICTYSAPAQHDSVAFTIDSRMNDGVFITYGDFRMNTAISKEQVKSNLDTEQLNFLEKALQQKEFSYIKNNILYTVESKTVWGFFQNNTLYVSYEGEFFRVPVFGSISYFIATVIVRNLGYYDPRFGYSMGPAYTRETREFVIDFYSGLAELTMAKAEELLSRDKLLYDEFMKLSRRKRKEQVYRFFRRYNELHPVYFLK